MNRIRTVKPEIRDDRKLASVPRATRYHAVLLITMGDDEGWFRASPRQLLAAMYPHDSDVTAEDVAVMTDELAKIGYVALFMTDDGPVGMLRNWKRHQKVDHPKPSPIAKLSRTPLDGLARASCVTSTCTSTSTEDQGAGGARASAPPPPPAARALAQDIYDAIPEAYHPAVDGALRQAKDPAAVAASIRALNSGLHGKYSWDIVGRALADWLASGEPFKARTLDVFCNDLRRRSEGSTVSDDVVLRVTAYANLRWKTDQAVTDRRKAMIGARLSDFGGELAALLYAVDGMADSEFATRTGKLTLEACFGSFGECERFAQAARWKPGRPHKYEHVAMAA